MVPVLPIFVLLLPVLLHLILSFGLGLVTGAIMGVRAGIVVLETSERFCGLNYFSKIVFYSRLVLFERELPVPGIQATRKVFNPRNLRTNNHFTRGFCLQVVENVARCVQ